MFMSSEVIASVHTEEQLQRILSVPEVKTIFLMNSNLLSAQAVIENIHQAGKKVCLHVDFIQGLATDATGLSYIAQYLKPEGIISTRAQVIQQAKKQGLFTIQRLFLIDSNAFYSGIKSINQSKPHAIEVMPGLMPRVIQELYEQVHEPIIAGGLVKNRLEIEAAFQAGAIAVSLSSLDIWLSN